MIFCFFKSPSLSFSGLILLIGCPSSDRFVFLGISLLLTSFPPFFPDSSPGKRCPYMLKFLPLLCPDAFCLTPVSSQPRPARRNDRSFQGCFYVDSVSECRPISWHRKRIVYPLLAGVTVPPFVEHTLGTLHPSRPLPSQPSSPPPPPLSPGPRPSPITSLPLPPSPLPPFPSPPR